MSVCLFYAEVFIVISWMEQEKFIFFLNKKWKKKYPPYYGL